jgi:hypothetical protein
VTQQVARMARGPKSFYQSPFDTLRHWFERRKWFRRSARHPGRNELEQMSQAEMDRFLATVGIDAGVVDQSAGEPH